MFSRTGPRYSLEHSLLSRGIWLFVTHRPPAPEHPCYCSAGAWLQRVLCSAANEVGEVPTVCSGTGEEQQGAGIAFAVNLLS